MIRRNRNAVIATEITLGIYKRISLSFMVIVDKEGYFYEDTQGRQDQ
jgi:hypothetical protein